MEGLDSGPYQGVAAGDRFGAAGPRHDNFECLADGLAQKQVYVIYGTTAGSSPDLPILSIASCWGTHLD